MSLAVSARGCLVVLLASLGMAPVSCSSSHDAEVVPRPAGDAFCNLPGSLRFDSSGHRTLVEGGAAKAPSLDWITLAIIGFALLRIFPSRIVSEHHQRLFHKARNGQPPA